MKSLFNLVKSKLRVKTKNFYYRMTVPFYRLIKKPMIQNPAGFSIEFSSICNFNCVFCAYQHTTDKMRQIMSLDDFKLSVNEVANNGGTRIALTPLTGDIFTDRIGILKKLNFLESHVGIKSYSFTTNASLLDEEKIKYLKTTKKLSNMKISIYGHDKDSFTKITQTKLYNKVYLNLLDLKKSIDTLNFRIQFGIRSYMDFNPSTCNSELLTIIKEMNKNKNVSLDFHRHYTNWGGYVSDKDLNGLPIILKDDKKGYKSGPCARLFNYMILSNSDVILCACRDAMREMVVGNIKEKSLKEIISIENPKYKKWINDQEEDKFNGPCKDCDMYRPVYALPHYELGKKQTRSYVNYDEFFK
mgnify:CR=1 FL=1